jgi:hypothetical protein
MVRMGHERFLIEDTVGLTINPQIYKDLHKPPEREKLRRFSDLESAVEELMESDRSEGRENYLLNKRRHRLGQRNLLVKVIQLVFGEQGLGFEGELTGAEIEERMAQFIAAHEHDMRLYFNRRADLSDKPVAIFRWLLTRIGVRLASRQVERQGARFMVYFLDAEHLAKWQGYATARRAHLAQQLAGAPPKITNSVEDNLRDFRELFTLTDEERGAVRIQKE